MTEAFTVRMGIFDTALWTERDIILLYKDPLKAAGFITDQLPVITYPLAPVTVTPNDPFPGAKRLTINIPPFGEFSQTRDTRVPYKEDPAKLAEAGKAFASIFTWNLCLPTPTPITDGAGVLRDIFRRTRPEGILKLSPLVSSFESARESEPGYPPRGPKPKCAGAPALGPGQGPGGARGGKGPMAALLVILGAWALSRKKKRAA